METLILESDKLTKKLIKKINDWIEEGRIKDTTDQLRLILEKDLAEDLLVEIREEEIK